MSTEALPDRRFSVEEYYAMARAGVIGQAERVELLNGQIVPMTPIGSRHAACVESIVRQIYRSCAEDVLVRVQSPIRVDDSSEPEPDIVLVRRGPDYRDCHPSPADVLLAIEVADSSLERDTGAKRAMYAEAGIRELWVVNLRDHRIQVYRGPRGADYSIEEESTNGQVTPELVPAVRVALGELEW